MKIYLEGLIVHAEHHQRNQQVAYLIYDPHHEALLSVEPTFVNRALTNAQPLDDKESIWRYRLTGDVGTSLGLRAPEIYKVNYLPSLKNEMAGGKRNGVPQTNATFFLPSLGEFDFPSYFNCKFAYGTADIPPSADDFQCVPRTVLLTPIPVVDDVTFTNGDGTRIVLLPSANVWITNRCTTPSGPEVCYDDNNPHKVNNPHSAAYANFYATQPPTIAVPYVGSKCPDPRAKPLPKEENLFDDLLTIDVDCASSRYP